MLGWATPSEQTCSVRGKPPHGQPDTAVACAAMPLQGLYLPASLPHAMRRSPRRTCCKSSPRGVPPPGPGGEASGNPWPSPGLPLSHWWTPPRGLGSHAFANTSGGVFQGFHLVVLALTCLTTGSSATTWPASMTLSTMITWRLGPVTVANA